MRAAGAQNKRAHKDLLPVILYTAVDTIKRHEGVVRGLRFAKMVIHIHRELEAAGHLLRLPRRWYLYGEVPEVWDTPCAGSLEITDPDDELDSIVRWIGRPPKLTGHGLEHEIREMARRFEERFGDETLIPDMLREHYRPAPLEFQRAMLEFWLMVQEIRNYHSPDDQRRTIDTFDRVIRSYDRSAVEIEPRLQTIFMSLSLLEKMRLATRQVGDVAELLDIHSDVWGFWKKFCRFLSVKRSCDISETRLERYRTRAERELGPYLAAMPQIISIKFERLAQNHPIDTMLASEAILQRDWSSKEEADAWANL